MKKYIVKLTKEERGELKRFVNKGKGAAKKITHARILLKADSSSEGDNWKDKQISKALDVSVRTIERVRQRFVEESLEAALNRRPSEGRPRKLDGDGEARLTSIACSQAPEGQTRWTLRMLADQMVELNYVESISHETVRQTLKKKEIKPWGKKEWCIPPEENAAFVCQMEDVLEVYKRPYDPKKPLVCMDESSKQTIKETRVPIPAKPGQVERYDTEYERNGVSNLFMFCEPLTGWREVKVTKRRTKIDWAKAMKDLVDDERYVDAEKITVVMDNLNTHKGASLYEAFEPEEARRILDRLEFHYTPKHGSWLNVAEIEFSILSRQCLDRRIPDEEALVREVKAWNQQRNNQMGKVDWQFTTEDARIKLKRLYPSLKE